MARFAVNEVKARTECQAIESIFAKALRQNHCDPVAATGSR
jgi:hypothetical protein